MYTGNSFEITAEQSQKISEWYKELPKANYGAIGGRITYCFTATGLGIILVVKDAVTKQELNVTDFDNW